jgi:molecular chaperone GrpE
MMTMMMMHHPRSMRNAAGGLRSFSDKTEETSQEEIAKEQEATADDVDDVTKQLQQQIQDLKDQLLRSLAEQENIRNIARNDVSAANQFAIKKFAKSLLDVADNLDRALDSVSEQDKTSDTFHTFYQGIEMTQQGLLKALEANGCKAMALQPGDAFNPELHSALMEYPDPTLEAGTVGQVIKKGYTLNNRVLRPAEVGVVKK